MGTPVRLQKADVRRALVAHHFAPCSVLGAFDRLRSVQYDPLSPVGSNHDLVLQSRVKGYQIGDWQKFAYKKREIYDGWDKMACLMPFSGWPLRRIYYRWHVGWSNRVREEHPEAVDAVLREIGERGPMAPRDFEFQAHRPDWKGSWYGPSVTKQALRALWHAGEIMTHSRKNGQHLYDLSERILPADLRSVPELDEDASIQGLIVERTRAMGIVPLVSPFEVWAMPTNVVRADRRNRLIQELVNRGEVVPVDLDGVAAIGNPEFLAAMGTGRVRREVRFLAPLDQLMWNRPMIRHVFGFDYLWEVYVPEPKRRWGYYVLPVLFGDKFVARVDVWCRSGVLEFRSWHWEQGRVPVAFWPAFEKALRRFMDYAGAGDMTFGGGVDAKVKEVALGALGN